MKRLALCGCCLLLILLACDENGSSGKSSDNSDNLYYRDADGDGYGDADQSTQASECPLGYVEDNTDCDDSDEDINPGLGTCVLRTFYLDADADGYGDPASPSEPAYKCPPGFVEDNTDCVDTECMVNPGAGNCPE